MRKEAAKKIVKVQKDNEKTVNHKRKAAREYEKGDFVVIRNFENTGGKLIPAYKGPYEVIKRLKNDRYVIADIERSQISQKPYKSTWEAANMKPWRKSSEQDETICYSNLDLESDQSASE